MGSGMEEIFQITSALKYLDFGKHVAVLTDARFSGVSTGACIGHVTPEALAGGPIGKVLDGDMIEIVSRPREPGRLGEPGGHGRQGLSARRKARACSPRRPLRPDLAPDPRCCPTIPGFGRRLQKASGGTWAGCVYDVDAIVETLAAGQAAKAGRGE